MNRTAFRNSMLLLALLLASLSFFFYLQGKKTQEKILNQNFTITSLQQELENVARLSASLTELDQMTMDEKTATQLNLLRHLNIEQDNYGFQVLSRQVLAFGDTNLFVRQVELRTDIPYFNSLKLLDDLYNNKKLQIFSITLEPSASGNQNVQMTIMGNVYGLEKNTKAEGSQ